MILENNSEQEIFRALNEIAFGPLNLNNQGYTFNNSISYNNQKITPFTSYQLIFSNVLRNMKISLSIIDYYDSALISIVIYKLIESGEYTGSLSLSDLLAKSFDSEDVKKNFNLEFYRGDLNERVESFCKWLNTVANRKLMDIIAGKEWVELPFDWGRYK